MRGIATAIMLIGMLWLAYWAARIGFSHTQGTLPMLAFVGGLLAVAGSLAYLSQPERSPDRAEWESLSQAQRNGHRTYSRTWPRTARRGR